MAKVLVTGASGFVGTHLVEALAERGDEVTCLVRKSSRLGTLRRLKFQLVYGDVTDRDSLAPAVAGRQIVYHIAGCTQALRPSQYYRVNRWGVANVAQVCAGQDSPPVLVTVSSLAAAGPAIDGRPKTETDRSE
ncbi:MAG: NAD-dependent epimerase/dehydratase family protein, partial [Pirellulaceae bacterium]|nr:NAD-dependent epimerase/dehydratase family protein [Pirellulaceae bacterium]